jgi:hypothetical protein
MSLELFLERQDWLNGQMVPDDMEVVEEDISRLHNEMDPTDNWVGPLTGPMDDGYYEEHHDWARDLGVVFDVEYFLGSE